MSVLSSAADFASGMSSEAELRVQRPQHNVLSVGMTHHGGSVSKP